MGNVLGLACGAKLASPRSHVVAFTGDGCFRLFAGGLGEASGLGILLFVLDNASYGIVEQGVPTIIPGLDRARRHTDLVRLDYAAMARACGWEASELTPGLETLDAVLDAHWRGGGRSHLVRVPIDPTQLLGANPRAHNL
jgi:acetolactate synthase-1/2/3 large subunit